MHVKPKRETIIKDGWYPATIGDAEERETKFGERLLVPFEVETEDGIVSIDAWWGLPKPGKLAHPKSNLVKFGKQLFGDREFDTDEFTGQSVEVFVVKEVKDDGEHKNNISKLRPAQGKKGKVEEAQVEIDESDFEDMPF